MGRSQKVEPEPGSSLGPSQNVKPEPSKKDRARAKPEPSLGSDPSLHMCNMRRCEKIVVIDENTCPLCIQILKSAPLDPFGKKLG